MMLIVLLLICDSEVNLQLSPYKYNMQEGLIRLLKEMGERAVL